MQKKHINCDWVLQAVYYIQLQFTNCLVRHQTVCKQYFDSLFTTFTGSDLSAIECTSIEHRLLLHNIFLFKEVLLHVATICMLCFQATLKILGANARHLFLYLQAQRHLLPFWIQFGRQKIQERCRGKSKEGYFHGKIEVYR